MTLISTRRIVSRETASLVRDRGKLKPVMIELHPGYMALRPKGRRMRFTLAYDSAYRIAVAAQVEAERRERREKRMKKRKGQNG